MKDEALEIILSARKSIPKMIKQCMVKGCSAENPCQFCVKASLLLDKIKIYLIKHK